MLKPAQFWILTAAGALAVVLALANMFLVQGNLALKAEVNGRGQYIQESVALQNLYNQIVQELAQRAVRTQDNQVRDLLAAEGIKLNMNAPANGGPK